MRGPTNLLILLLISLGATDGLRVTMKTPLISARRDQDVTIPCEFSDFTPGKTINVGWKKTQNGKSSEVYGYVPGGSQAIREGAYMEEESEIKKGNGALHLSRVQYSDEGDYTCIVVVTGEYKEGRSTLQVSAVPSAVLIPGDAINVELGNEKSALCEVSNFYPKDINIRWVRYEKDSSTFILLERGTWIGAIITNIDGTFNVTSQLTLYPTMEDGGHRYSCVVKHRSLPQDLMKDFTLTVTEREDNTGTIVTAVVLTVLLMTLISWAGFLYYQVFTKDPPVLSEITGNDRLTDMSRTTLTCHITNFKPNDLEISVCLRRRVEEKMRTIHTWRSIDHVPSVTMGCVDIDIEQQSLMNGGVSHTQGPLQLEMTPLITPNRSGLLRCIPWHRLYTYSCQCSVHITPSYGEDDGAEFSVHVSHPALTAPIYQKRTLRVIGVAPRLLKIVSPVYVTHKERMMLTCPINGFKPKPLHITWLKKDQNNRETELVTWNSNKETLKNEIHKVTEDELDDKSFSFLSALMMRANVREDGARYICRTYHPATKHRGEEQLILNVTAIPVLDAIKQTLGNVHAGDKMTLSCKIHSFYPAPIEVTWYTEDEQIPHFTVSDPLPDLSGLYQVTSSMTYTTTKKDKGKRFTCKVRHESTGAPKTATWRLEDLVSEPKVSEICSDPPFPQCDNMVTLSCDITDMHPKNIVSYWYKGNHRMPPEMCRESIQEDPESGTFRGSIELQFMADSGCHEEEFHMELIHCGKTIVRRHILILDSFSRSPALGDIISDPSYPRYGHPVTLTCEVTNAKPQDIKVMWLKGQKPLEKGQGEEKMITENDRSLSCSLRIIPTALDYGKAYICSVTHKDLKELLRKIYYITLPDKPPVFSAITVWPERPVAGKEAIFTVTIYGFTPDIKVKWHKDFNMFPRDVFTTSDPQIGVDSLCTCTSTLRFTPQDKDHKANIRCEATHSVTKKVYEKLCTLDLTGGGSEKPEEHPSLSTQDPRRHLKSQLRTGRIQCLTENPRVGDTVTLICYIDGCEWDRTDITWRKGSFPIDPRDIQNRNLEDGPGSSSTVAFIAEETDRNCIITCEVTYGLQTKQEHFTLKLQ